MHTRMSRQVHDKKLHELKLKMHKLYKVKRASNPSFIAYCVCVCVCVC